MTWWDRVLAFFTGKSPGKPSRASASPGRRDDSHRDSSSRGGSRHPERVDVTSPKLYVGNLSYDATENDLHELFNGVGSVRSAEVVAHRDTQRSKGFAFVTMSSVAEAKRAVEELHDELFMGRKLNVSGSKNGDMRQSEGRHI